LVAVSPHTINPSLYRNLPYDTVKDFIPVVLAATVMPVLVVHPGISANTLKEFIDLAKSQPGTMSYASAGNGSTQHLAGELFKSVAGIELVHVPYKGGAPAVTDLIGKQVSAYFPNIPTVLPHIRAGRLKAIAVTGARRSPLLPTVPTAAEAGLAGFEVTDWYGLLVVAHTSPDIVAKLNAEVNGMLRTPETRNRLTELGFEVAGGTPEQFAELIKVDMAKWAKAVKFSGARID
jgi:tripartite-type tricarboxylate transporter receptor subunit TctC